MWWKAILFCLMTDGPASSKCDFTLIKSVTPLRSTGKGLTTNLHSVLAPYHPCVQCWWKKQHARGLLSARWLMSWPTKAIHWYVTTKVCDAKFAICTEPTDSSDSGAVTLVCHGQAPPRSSPFSKTRKDSSSTRQQETHVTFSTNLVNAVKRPVNTTRKNSYIALLWVIGTSSAHTVTQSITFCLFLLSPNSISHTLINVTPFLKLPSRVVKVIMF